MRRRIAVLILALQSAGELLILTLSVAQMAEPPGPWIKYTGNPVVVTGTVGSWDAGFVGDPTVISDGTTYKMWYHGGDASYSIFSIGYATSTNGITWTKYAANPVLTGTAGSWDANIVAGADVVFEVTGVPQALPEGIAMLRDSGQYITLGHFTDNGTVDLNPFEHFTSNQIDLKGVWGAHHGHLVRSREIVESGKYALEQLVTHEVSLEDLDPKYSNFILIAD